MQEKKEKGASAPFQAVLIPPENIGTTDTPSNDPA
jgi:hypothetical protein